jgi:lipopolysaccharide/colanic/teichoic acid biosynthesis glycosyltransferase
MHDASVSLPGSRRPSAIGPRAARSVASPGKRAIDIAGSLFGLVCLSPVFALISLAIRLDSRGPALFTQTRIGLRGAPFRIYKFRTMVCGNDPAAHQRYVTQLIRDGSADLMGASGCYKLEDDDRITRAGRFLRRFSLDELPQLINVLKGEMSLVGPRPPLRYEVELYTPRTARRLDVRPGMSGLWQVSGRTETTFQEMVDLDLAYIDRWSLRLDAVILLRTISVVLGGRGAV